MFTGFVDAPTDGLYTFYINSDDGSQLFIGDQLVVNNDGTHAENEESGLIALQAGLHPFTVLFFENAGQEVLTVSWAPPSQSKETIGDEHFVYDTDDLLPVELTFFEALLDGDEVVLMWETASELNNAGFFVERILGTDGVFESIGFVEGSGSTTQTQKYTYKDTHLPDHIEFASYRLRQVDFDGQFAFSEVVHVQRESSFGIQLFANYPNPFNPSTKLSFTLPESGQVRLSVYDLSGRHIETLVDEQRSAGFHELTYSAGPSLTSGLYIYRLVTSSQTQSGTMLLLK